MMNARSVALRHGRRFGRLTGVLALAVDLGTTAAKVSVVAVDGRILGSGMEPVTTVFGPGGAAEQDAEAVWGAVCGAARAALVAAGAAAASGVAVVCCTSQWASLVPVDGTGRPVGPLVMWLDHRGRRRTEALTATDANLATWLDVHGLSPSTSLTHLLWMQHDRPDIHTHAAAYLEPMDYLNARFTGRIVATACTAMPLALTDNRHLNALAWSQELIGRAGVDPTRLPDLIASLTVVGEVRADVANLLGLRPGVVVVAAANDSIAAAIGTNAVDPGRATVIMGTTGVLAAHHPTRVVDHQRSVVTMPSALRDRYYVMAEAGLGGKVLETFLHQIVDADDAFGTRSADSRDPFGRLDAAVDNAPAGADGVLFLPWLIGSYAPAIDARHRGAFLGLSLGTTRSHLLRAVLEGIALQMRWLTDEVEAALGVAIPIVRFCGGGATSDAWAQIMADVLGRIVEQVAEPRQANARGAGLLAFLSLGQLQPCDLEPIVPIQRVYEPASGTRDLFGERLAVYRDLHERLAEPVARLRAHQ